MKHLLVWPAESAGPLADLAAQIAVELDLDTPAPLSVDAVTDDTLALVICGPDSDPTEILTGIANTSATLVAVVSDAYLGTDTDGLDGALAGATAVATIRSIAARMGDGARANAVCVPDTLWDADTVQRGPLATATEVSDVAKAAAFLFGDEASYLTGQVLFVNGGRHIFSSMSA